MVHGVAVRSEHGRLFEEATLGVLYKGGPSGPDDLSDAFYPVIARTCQNDAGCTILQVLRCSAHDLIGGIVPIDWRTDWWRTGGWRTGMVADDRLVILDTNGDVFRSGSQITFAVLQNSSLNRFESSRNFV